MKHSRFAAGSFAGCVLVAACQAIVGIDDRSESTPLVDAGNGADTSSGSSSSGSSGASSSGSSGASSSGSSGSSGTDASDGSMPYDVRALAGLKLWLESTKELVAGSSGGATLATWSDQSGAWDAGAAGAPDGGRHVAEPEGVNPPTIVANGINGRPTLSLVNGNGYVHIANHADFLFGLGDFLIVEVAKVSSGTGPLWYLAQNVTAGSEEQFLPGQLCVSYGMGVTDGCTLPAFAASAGPHVFVARRKGDVFTVRVDGAVESTVDRSADPPNIHVADYQQPFVFIGNAVTMQVSEVIVILGPTPDADLTTLEAHLKAKYAIL